VRLSNLQLIESQAGKCHGANLEKQLLKSSDFLMNAIETEGLLFLVRLKKLTSRAK